MSIKDSLNRKKQLVTKSSKMAMDKKDLTKMEELLKLSVDEEAENEGISSELFFETYEFENDFKRSKGTVKIDFSKYSLKSYRGGRLLQLRDENDKSPLKLRKTESSTKSLISYNPYLSLINGKVVISR